MYTSIDLAAHSLNRKLLKYKERREQGFHSGNGMGENLMNSLDALQADLEAAAGFDDSALADEFVDPEAQVVTKINTFDLDNSIPLEEAIFALDYIDHDFYVFKNKETDKVNVVYKRNAGGVGLIEV
jgi:putative sigma-54 modulation protein